MKAVSLRLIATGVAGLAMAALFSLLGYQAVLLEGGITPGSWLEAWGSYDAVWLPWLFFAWITEIVGVHFVLRRGSFRDGRRVIALLAVGLPVVSWVLLVLGSEILAAASGVALLIDSLVIVLGPLAAFRVVALSKRGADVD